MTKSQILKQLLSYKATSDPLIYERLKSALIEDVRLEECKSNNLKSSDIQIVKRLFKAHTKYQNVYRKIKFGGHVYNSFCNGIYVLFDIANDFGYPECTTDIQALENHLVNKLKVVKEVKEISLVDLKAFYKLNSDNPNSCYLSINLGKVFIGYNPRFLLDVLNFCNSDKISVFDSGIAYVESEDKSRFGILCPIVINNKGDRQYV